MIADLKPYLEYRETGSLWLGKVPAHWGVHSLRTLIKSRNERNRPDLPLLSVAREKGVFVRSLAGDDDNHNVIPDDLSNYKVARTGNLIINKMKAWQGSMGVAPCDGVVSPAYYVFDFDIKNTDYGQALLRSKPYVAHFGQASDGVRVGQWDLSIPGMRQIPVVIPPPDEQAAIVRFLNYANLRIEKAIRAKRKVIALLNEQKQVIIHRAVTRGIDPNVQLKPSGIPWLGDIPEHWEEISVGAATNLIQTGPFGSQLHSHEYVDGGIPVINPSHMKDGQIIADTSISISPVKAKELERHKIKIGDIIAARRGELGRCAVVTPEEVGWICGTGSLLIRCKLTMFIPNFFQMVFASQGIRDSLSLASIGATMDNLNAGMVARLRIPMPSISEQNQIIEFVKNENQRHGIITSAILHEIDLLREYRTRLIADVVTGKLDVRQAAARLPDEPEELATLQDCGETAELNDNGLDAEDES